MSWGLRDVSVEYGTQLALDDISVTAEAGRIVAIVGGDGAGKTTALRALAGRIVPGAGRVERPELARIGYQPSSSGVWRGLSVAENMAFVGRCYAMAEHDRLKRQRELLELAGLADVTNRLGGQLSGGMRQKLGFAMALLHRPDLILLDEPTTGVDPVSRVELWQMISLAAADGSALVMATTYLDEAERARDVLVLDAGHALAAGGPDEILAAVPGTIAVSPHRPAGAGGAWRRGTTYHAWFPPGVAASGERVAADMEDAVVALTLARAAGIPTRPDASAQAGSGDVPTVRHG